MKPVSSLFAVLLGITTACLAADRPERAVLRVDTRTRHQTMEGWGATLSTIGIPFGQWLGEPTAARYDALGVTDPLAEKARLALLDAVVDDLGLNRFRLEVGPQVVLGSEPEMPQYRFAWQDVWVKKWLLPLRERIERRGEKMVVYVSYDLRSSLSPAWLLEPEAYADMAVAFLRHLEAEYQLEPDYWTTLNEPGNERPGDPQLVARLIAATGKRIKEAGSHTRMSGPEVVTPQQLPDYLEAMEQTPGALGYLRQISYHLYWDPTNLPARHEARDWARRLGITAAQTEWMEPKELDAAEHLYLDLTEADVSAWEQYSLRFTENEYNTVGGDYFVLSRDYSSFRMNVNSWYLRQFMHYIRPGAVRVGISSQTPSIKPVAFLTPQCNAVVVVINSGEVAAPIRIADLPAGRYAVSYTARGIHGKELPSLVVGRGAAAAITVPAEAVMTISGR